MNHDMASMPKVVVVELFLSSKLVVVEHFLSLLMTNTIGRIVVKLPHLLLVMPSGNLVGFESLEAFDIIGCPVVPLLYGCW